MDVARKLSSALVPFGIIVVGLSLLLLLAVFRSLVVPVKAAIGFLLSVAASFGAVVAVFQWGWLDSAVGLSKTGPIACFLPIILMAVLFGLAMDYEVFLVSRIRESYTRLGDPKQAIVAGGGAAARVVVAAALIMASIFASYVASDSAIIKPIAFSLAIGVACDALLVRMTIVPAVLALTGKAAWHLPRWLNRILPNLDIEGASLQNAVAAPTSTVLRSSRARLTCQGVLPERLASTLLAWGSKSSQAATRVAGEAPASPLTKSTHDGCTPMTELPPRRRRVCYEHKTSKPTGCSGGDDSRQLHHFDRSNRGAARTPVDHEPVRYRISGRTMGAHDQPAQAPRISASDSTAAPAFSTFCPSTRTLPARIMACARSRDAASPRSKISLSILIFIVPSAATAKRKPPAGGFVFILVLLDPTTAIPPLPPAASDQCQSWHARSARRRCLRGPRATESWCWPAGLPA